MQPEVVYVGIDVHFKKWVICCLGSDDRPAYHTLQVKDVAKSVAELHNIISMSYPNHLIRSVYEHGPWGQYLHNQLIKNDWQSIIENPNNVPKSTKERLHKSDKRDAFILAKNLKRGELKGTVLDDHDHACFKKIVRQLRKTIDKKTASKNRCSQIIYNHGITLKGLPSLQKLTDIAKANPILGKDIEFQEAVHDFATYTEKVKRLEEERDPYLNKARYAAIFMQLTSIEGIGKIIASELIAELGDAGRFPRIEAFKEFVGIAPCHSQSGASQKSYFVKSNRPKKLSQTFHLATKSLINKNPKYKALYKELKEKKVSHPFKKVQDAFAKEIFPVWQS